MKLFLHSSILFCKQKNSGRAEGVQSINAEVHVFAQLIAQGQIEIFL
jgi:hypothetical protein